jgi:hypothetical protein
MQCGLPASELKCNEERYKSCINSYYQCLQVDALSKTGIFFSMCSMEVSWPTQQLQLNFLCPFLPPTCLPCPFVLELNIGLQFVSILQHVRVQRHIWRVRIQQIATIHRKNQCFYRPVTWSSAIWVYIPRFPSVCESPYH